MWFIDDDATRWGNGTGERHSRAKIDDNFWEAKSRLDAIEANAAAGIFPTGATLSGTQITFLYSDPSANVTFEFPVLVWNWRDEWLSSTLYAKLDTLRATGFGLFIVLIDHVSATTFDPAATDGLGNPLYLELLPLDAHRYVIGASWPGLMTAANQNLMFHRFTSDVLFPANFGAYLNHTSQAGASITATGSTAIDVAKALTGAPTSFSTIGSITIAAGTVTPTFATSGGAAIAFAQGDIIRLRGPATPDATLADLFCALVARET